MAEDLSPDEQKIVALTTRLARERFAPRAAQYDTENSFPHDASFTSRARAALASPFTFRSSIAIRPKRRESEALT